MNLSEYIYKRKSIRKYEDKLVPNEILSQIRDFFNSAKRLYPDIKVEMEIVDKNQVKSPLSWLSHQVITIYSEEKPGYLENVGFVFEQVSLYLNHLGLGSCWIGMGKINENTTLKRSDNLKYVIMMSFGYPQGDLFRELDAFKRKVSSKIATKEDKRLEPARLAPSSVNTQPWYFCVEEAKVDLYRNIGLIQRFLDNMNQIDVGIALSHIYLSNIDTFKCYKESTPTKIKGHEYIITFTL